MKCDESLFHMKPRNNPNGNYDQFHADKMYKRLNDRQLNYN